LSVGPGTSSHGRSIERLFEEAIMAVLVTRTPLPIGGDRPRGRLRVAFEVPPQVRPRPVALPRRGAGERPAGLLSAPPVRRPVASCERVYARRRLVALLAAGLLVAAMVLGLGMLRAAASDNGVPERTQVVQVRSGETLWELAERVAPESPTPAVVERIRQLNSMNGSTVHPGQPLIVPAG
jgi:LysM domain